MAKLTRQTIDTNSVASENVDNESLESDREVEREFVGTFQGLAQLLATFPILVYECDNGLNVTRVNTTPQWSLGVNRQKMFGPEGLWQAILFPDDRDRLISLGATLKSGQTKSAIHRILDKRSLPIWVSHSLSKQLTDDGEVLRGCMLQVSDEICTQQVDPAIISQFLHKLGNHFQLINLLLGNLYASGVPAGEVEKLQLAIDDTVDFTRTFLAYAQGPSCRSEFAVNGILSAVIETMDYLFAEKKISLQHVSPSRVGHAVVLGDPFLMESAFRAILENALEASEEGGVIEVTQRFLRYGCDFDESIQIVISDKGCGMEEDVLVRATDAFFTTRRDRKGLGLTVALRIIEQHGGTMRIESAVGQGTQIRIVLPLTNPTIGKLE